MHSTTPQTTVREEFRTSTLITIAHRLHTIIDCELVGCGSRGVGTSRPSLEEKAIGP